MNYPDGKRKTYKGDLVLKDNGRMHTDERIHKNFNRKQFNYGVTS
jgi:uncharacterized protein YaiI (UPF0178 family)